MRFSPLPLLPKSHLSPVDDDPTRSPFGVGVTGGVRKKANNVRAWLLLDVTGQAQVVEAGKHAIMRRTGLPARDLRILDPLLSYPSTVLGRERAIVINLEHIKAIITAHEVLLLNSKDPAVVPFAQELQPRISRHHCAKKSQEGRVNGSETDCTNLYGLGEPQSEADGPPNVFGGFPKTEDGGKAEGIPAIGNQDGLKVLPFEFIALEACLEAACSSLDNEARTLELEAHPALDKLTSQISSFNLERVRQIKSRLVAITGRVQKVRDELEHLLDDDGDMAEMYLTEKLVQQEPENSASSEDNGTDDDEVLQTKMDGSDFFLEDDRDSANYEGDLQHIDNSRERFGASNGGDSHGPRTTAHSDISKHLDVKELEMLLEAYFVQIEGTLNKLSTLREYVDDTEDYINIMLDDKQNNLLQMGVMLTLATVLITSFVVVCGVLGMNIKIELFNEVEDGMQHFMWTVGGCTACIASLYVVAIAWWKHKRLLE